MAKMFYWKRLLGQVHYLGNDMVTVMLVAVILMTFLFS